MFVLSPFIALESGEGSQGRRKWISWTTCCNFHCCFSSKLSAQVLLENGDTLIQLFLQCLHRGTLGMGRKESHTSHQCLIFIFILICYIFSLPIEKPSCFFFSPLSRPIIGPALPPGFRKPSEDTRSRCFIGPSVSSESHPKVCEKRSLLFQCKLSEMVKQVAA